jgi:uncharacterized protein YjbI with pentapeptide repeats
MADANLTNASLIGVKLVRAVLSNATLANANIESADFHETTIECTSFELVKGAPNALRLLTTKISSDVLYFSTVARAAPERYLDWERIRIAGRLPLFGVPYAGLIVIPAYVYFLEIYNQNIQAARTWISTNASLNGISDQAAKAILNHLNIQPIPESFFLLFVSTIALAIAATIYGVACPSRIKEFSRNQWCDELGHSLVHYWPEAWKQRRL